MFDFSGKVALITGAGGNLGRATTAAFAAAGARLALVGRTYEELARAFPGQEERDDVLFLVGDLADANTVQGLVHEVIQSFGRVDVLANIAGVYRNGRPLHEMPLEMWDFLLNVNARSVLHTGRAVTPYMLRQRSGKIINVAARSALQGAANMGAYVVSKSAVIRLTETMAEELKEHGINVNCILPGTLDTPQNRQNRPDEDHSRWVPPEALADVILFLASDLARAIHGASIPIYGLS